MRTPRRRAGRGAPRGPSARARSRARGAQRGPGSIASRSDSEPTRIPTSGTRLVQLLEQADRARLRLVLSPRSPPLREVAPVPTLRERERLSTPRSPECAASSIVSPRPVTLRILPPLVRPARPASPVPAWKTTRPKASASVDAGDRRARVAALRGRLPLRQGDCHAQVSGDPELIHARFSSDGREQRLRKGRPRRAAGQPASPGRRSGS
jgi:hypothetical protein